MGVLKTMDIYNKMKVSLTISLDSAVEDDDDVEEDAKVYNKGATPRGDAADGIKKETVSESNVKDELQFPSQF